MRIVFFGCTKYSEELLTSLLGNNLNIVGVFSIPKYFSISYSEEKVENTNYADLEQITFKHQIPYHEIDSVEGQRTKNYMSIIQDMKPDVILVLGWYYMVPRSIRDIATYGAWGIHASLLPNYAGGAPLVWAIINGEKETGVTLFRMEDGVDNGDIIFQESFTIEKDDTIKEVYEKATIVSKSVLNKVFKMDFKKIQFISQKDEDIKIFPQRTPDDGEIDWSWDSNKIKDFIRAQTKPYPGAFTVINGKKITIWDADVKDIT